MHPTISIVGRSESGKTTLLEGLIAELKRASPSKGILAPHLDLFPIAAKCCHSLNVTAVIATLPATEALPNIFLSATAHLRYPRSVIWALPFAGRNTLANTVALVSSWILKFMAVSVETRISMATIFSVLVGAGVIAAAVVMSAEAV